MAGVGGGGGGSREGCALVLPLIEGFIHPPPSLLDSKGGCWVPWVPGRGPVPCEALKAMLGTQRG